MLRVLLLLCFAAGLEIAQASNPVTNFTFFSRRQWTNHAGRVFIPNAAVSLSDFEGQILFLEFFDPTCSDCAPAAMATIPGIGNWYKALKGSLNGIPVTQVHVNIVPQDFLQPQVEAVISELGIEICANDYNFSTKWGPLETNVVHDLFAPAFVKPLFVMINCVSNSPGNAQWSVLLNQAASPPDWNSALTQWRGLIDGMQAPPPQLTGTRRTGAGVFEFAFPGQRGRTNRVERSTDLVNWTALMNAFGSNGPVLFRETNTMLDGPRLYRVRRF